MKQEIIKSFKEHGINVRIKVFTLSTHTVYRVCTRDYSPHGKLAQEIVANLGLTSANRHVPGGNINQAHEMFTYDFN